MIPVEHLLTLVGSDISPTYAAGSTLYVGRPAFIRAYARIRLSPGSAVAQVVFKWQGTLDPSDPDGWEDVASRRDDNAVTELEHTYSALGTHPVAHSFIIDARGFGALRLLARSASGVGQAGDEIRVSGLSW